MEMDWDTDWVLYSFEKPVNVKRFSDQDVRENKELEELVAGGANAKGFCPKCGRRIGRGIYFHIKYCEG